MFAHSYVNQNPKKITMKFLQPVLSSVYNGIVVSFVIASSSRASEGGAGDSEWPILKIMAAS
jgi:hypothetical protein